MILLFAASMQSTQHQGESSKAGCLIIRMVLNVYQRTVVSVILHYKNPTKRVGLVQTRHHYHLIGN
jgi:hypothetical protein